MGREDPLEKDMAIHSSILAWRIPWTEGPGGLQFMGIQRFGHNWVTNTFTFVAKRFQNILPRLLMELNTILPRYLTLPFPFPLGSDCKESARNAGDPGFNPWMRKNPLRREWLPTPVFSPGEFHGQRSLAGYSLQGHKESHATEVT